MCVICLMIDNSIPSAKSLVNSLNETNVKEEHVDSILDKISEKMPEDTFKAYLNDLQSEMYLDFLRST